MQFDNVLGTGRLVQPVNILGYQRKALESLFKVTQGIVPRVGFDLGDDLSPPVVPFPDDFGVTDKRRHSSQFLCPKLFPQTFIPAESGHSRLRGNPGSGQDRTGAAVANGSDNFIQHCPKIPSTGLKDNCSEVIWRTTASENPAGGFFQVDSPQTT